MTRPFNRLRESALQIGLWNATLRSQMQDCSWIADNPELGLLGVKLTDNALPADVNWANSKSCSWIVRWMASAESQPSVLKKRPDHSVGVANFANRTLY